MKVLHISPTYFSPQSHLGGGERYALELSKALAGRIETKLVSFGKVRETHHFGSLTLEIYPYWFLFRGNLDNPVSPTFLKEFFGADIIHCHQIFTLPTSFSIMMAKLLGKKVFVTDSGSLLPSLINKLQLFSKIDGFLLLSNFSASLVDSPREKTRIIYGGVDTEIFRPLPFSQKENYVLCVSRLLPHKGINYLIEAIDGRAPLKIVGTEADERYLNDLQKQAEGKSVEFIRNARNEDVVEYYQRAAVAVQPSVFKDVYGRRYTNPELLGLTVLESMACGTPVIVTEVASLPELVNERVGFVVPPNNPPAIGEKVDLLLKNKRLAEEMGWAAREHVLRNFTWDKVVERCLEAYR